MKTPKIIMNQVLKKIKKIKTKTKNKRHNKTKIKYKNTNEKQKGKNEFLSIIHDVFLHTIKYMWSRPSWLFRLLYLSK